MLPRVRASYTPMPELPATKSVMDAPVTPAPTGPLTRLRQWAGWAPVVARSRDGRVEELDSGEALTLDDPQSLQLVCLRGMLWITQEGKHTDDVLERGQRFVTDLPARLLVHAIGSARVHIGPRLR